MRPPPPRRASGRRCRRHLLRGRTGKAAAAGDVRSSATTTSLAAVGGPLDMTGVRQPTAPGHRRAQSLRLEGAVCVLSTRGVPRGQKNTPEATTPTRPPSPIQEGQEGVLRLEDRDTSEECRPAALAGSLCREGYVRAAPRPGRGGGGACWRRGGSLAMLRAPGRREEGQAGQGNLHERFFSSLLGLEMTSATHKFGRKLEAGSRAGQRPGQTATSVQGVS